MNINDYKVTSFTSGGYVMGFQSNGNPVLFSDLVSGSSGVISDLNKMFSYNQANNRIDALLEIDSNDDIVTSANVIAQSVITDSVQFNMTPTPVGVEGEMYWDVDEETVDINMPYGVVLQIGQEMFYHVKNQTGATIANGTPVMFAGSLGASGRLLIQPAIADGSIEADYIMGVATNDIVNGSDGFITQFGKVRGIDTSGAPYGEVWADGDILYVSDVTPGYLTNVPPQAPNLQIKVAAVVKAHASTGTLQVNPIYRGKMVDMDDVNGTPLTSDGQFAVWDNTHKYFDFTKNINDYTTKTGTFTDNAILRSNGITGDVQTSLVYIDDSGNLNIPTGAVYKINGAQLSTSNVLEGSRLYYTDARVSANTDVAANTAARHDAVTIGTANGLSLSTQILSLGLSSSTTNGALSSTDWNTFNNKQDTLTADVDYLTPGTAASTYVPLTRTVAGKTLSSNVSIASSDLSDGSTLLHIGDYGLGGYTNNFTPFPTDFNNILNTGFYTTIPSTTNAPTTNAQSVLNIGRAATYTTQISSDYIGNNLYLRNQIDGSWGSWSKIWHSGNSNLATVNWSANNMNVAGQYQVNGSQISSSNLSDGSNLAKLDGTQPFTGINSFSGSSSPIKLIGTGTGTANISYLPFYESNGTIRQGYVGFGSGGTDIFYIHNDIHSHRIELGSNLNYYDGTAVRSIWHAGNSNLSTVDWSANNMNIAGQYQINGNQISTSDVLEGSRLYYTDARVKSYADGLYVPLARTVAGKALSSNITLASSDLSDGSNLAKLNAANVFTQNQTISLPVSTPAKLTLFSNNYDASLVNNEISFDYYTSDRGMKIQSVGNTSGFVNKLRIGDVYTGSFRSTVEITSGIYGGGLNLVTGQYQVNGTQISSSDLSDGSNLAKLNAANNFTLGNNFGGIRVSGDIKVYNGAGLEIYYNATNQTSTINSYDRGVTNTYHPMVFGASSFSFNANINTTGQYQVNGSQIASTDLADGSNLAKLNADNPFTGLNTFSSGGSYPVKINGSGTGIANTAYIPFYESNGTTRQGYIGFGSGGTNIFYVTNDISNTRIELGSNLNFYTGGSYKSIWHAGNSNLSTVDWAAKNMNVAGQYQVNGTQIASSDLSDGASIWKTTNAGSTSYDWAANNLTVGTLLTSPTAQFTGVGTTAAVNPLGIDASGNLTTNVAAGTSGTWTPTFTTLLNFSWTSTQVAEYYQVGNLVTVVVRVIASLVTGNNTFRMTLPITSTSSNSYDVGIIVTSGSDVGDMDKYSSTEASGFIKASASSSRTIKIIYTYAVS